MLCCSQHKGRKYFQAEGPTNYKKNDFQVNSTPNTFQRKCENFD